MIDVLVAGRSLPALLAALNMAEVGLSVAVADGPFDVPSEPQRDVAGGLTAFLERIAAPIGASSGGDGRSADHPGVAPRRIEPSSPWLIDRAGKWAPQSHPTVLGIPTVPLAAENLRLLGSGGATRAYMDRVTPLLTVGKTRSLGVLVNRRLGRKARERLVEPQVRERFGVAADDVDVAVAAPGLNEALSRAGSLSAAALAYLERFEASETVIEPADGWDALVRATLGRLESYGVEFSGSAAVGFRMERGNWRIELASGESVEARALILDRVDEGPAAELVETFVSEAVPRAYRVYANFDIDSVDGLDDAACGVRTLGEWSVRVSPREGQAPRRGRLSGPAVATPRRDFSEFSGEEIASQFGPTLATVGITVSPDADWSVAFRVAPYATIADRHRLAKALQELNEGDFGAPLLAVGTQMHGDDVSEALHSADLSSITLRRRLLGLAD